MKGKVKVLKLDRGYGFITGDDARTYFLHATECTPRGIFDLMSEGVEVEFDWKVTAEGLRAILVRCDELRSRLAS